MQIPEITRLVVGSIEGLEYDAVSTVLFAADEIDPAPLPGLDETQPAMVQFFGLKMPVETRDQLKGFLTAVPLYSSSLSPAVSAIGWSVRRIAHRQYNRSLYPKLAIALQNP